MLLNALSLQVGVQPKAGSPGVVAQTQSAGSAGGSPPAAQGAGGGLVTLLPLLIMVPVIFMMFRRQKKEQQLRATLKKGDRVVSQSGLVGELIEMDERLAKVKIAPGTTVQMLVTSLSPLDPAVAKPAGDKALDDLKDAKIAAEKK